MICVPDIASDRGAPRRELSLPDAVCLVVGIIIGVGVYQMAPAVVRGVGSGTGVLLIWILGGLLSLCGALTYAELASAWPRAGGDYVYLTRAYGSWAGFLFGWLQLAVVRPGDIAVMAFAFALYARAINPAFSQTGYAVAAVMALTAINVLSVHKGKWTQNILTAVKALGLLFIVAAGIWAGPSHVPAPAVEPLPFSLALIFVLFSFGGWNEMAYVAAEVKNPRRNIVRTPVSGLLMVTALYLLLNATFLYVLGFDGLRASEAVATGTVAAVLPRIGGRLIGVLICISALGAVNGLIFTGAHISYAAGKDHALFRLLGRWNSKTGTPVCALLLQGGLAVVLILLLGSFIDAIVYTAPAVYTFYCAVWP